MSKFPKYKLTDKQLRGIACIVAHEQGTLAGMLAEASQIANRTDIRGDSYATAANLVKTVTSGWYAHGKSRYNKGTSNATAIKAVKLAICEGYRTLPRYIDEHDCMSDIATVKNGSTNVKGDKSRWIPHKTVIHNRMSSTYTFYAFPGGYKTGVDPFGYTSKAMRDKWGDFCYTVVEAQNGGKAPEEKAEKKEPARTRDDVVKCLEMLKGITEGSQSHKLIIDTFNKSGLCTRYKMTLKDPWCATTVSFAFIVNKLAGRLGSGAVFQCVECSCAKMVELAKKQGIWKESDSYIPQKGDVIMYDWQDSGVGDNKGTPDHVGIVVSVKDGVIKVIEGNYKDSIGERSIKVNGKNIRGFILPKYPQDAAQKPQKAAEATKAVSYYKSYKGKSDSIVDALKALGVKDTSKTARGKIAKANGISCYTGTASQNQTLLTLLKAGKLKKA